MRVNRQQWLAVTLSLLVVVSMVAPATAASLGDRVEGPAGSAVTDGTDNENDNGQKGGNENGAKGNNETKTGNGKKGTDRGNGKKGTEPGTFWLIYSSLAI